MYKNNEKEIGVIVQNIETEFPELILETYDTNYRVNIRLLNMIC